MAPKNHKSMKKSGLTMNKTLGQHLLTNPLVIKSIVEKSWIEPSDIVLEIGPGTGNLTMKLLEKAKKVIAIEKDKRLAAELIKRAQESSLNSKLQVIVGDCLKVDFPYFDLCISNTPYQISSPLVFKLLKHRPFCRGAVLMFQKEFATRLVSQAGDSNYCRLSINVQLQAKVTHLIKVSRNCFSPPPKVESSVVRIVPTNPAPPINLEEWNEFIKILFNRKNKTILANFKASGIMKMLEKNYKLHHGIDEEFEVDIQKEVEKLVEESGIRHRRPRSLDIDELLSLFADFCENGLHFC